MIVSMEDVLEMSGVETLHPGGFDLSHRIGELVTFTPATRVLDVSSGKGAFACSYARESGCRVTGIDINPRFVAIAGKRAQREGVAGRVDFRLGDARRLPFRDGEFDVVVNECAVGLTAISNPLGVLREMVRASRTGGKVVIHENTWLKDFPGHEKAEAARRLGTTPFRVQEWQQMLVEAGAVPEIVEDWSGRDNIVKMRPGRRWNPNSLSGFLTTREKLALFPRIIQKHGIGAIPELYRSGDRLGRYYADGYLGYVLIVAAKA